MKAFVLRQHGPDGARLERDFPDPVPGDGDVVVRVRATSLNYHDVFTRRGMPGIRIAMPAIMGLDVAGEIAAIGPGVKGWQIGDRVVGDPINRVEGGLTGETVHGGLAEYCRLRAHQLVRIPDGVSFAQAAALPCAYGTARRMMFTNGQVAAGEKVLMLGASGGVGVCAVQLAKAAGATVIAATSSEEKAARLRALGADHTINYAERDFVHAGLRPLRQAGAARRRQRQRRRCRRQLHRRRHLDEEPARPQGRRAPADLRRHRRLRPQGGHPLHLDLRTEDPRLQRLGARRHHRAAWKWCRRAASKRSSTRPSRWSARRKRWRASKSGRCSASW